jgi:hypothetical protein
MAGALANTIALVLAGVFLLASWRWYFRFITIIIAPFSVSVDACLRHAPTPPRR